MATDQSFDIFISYNHASAKAAVKELYEKLKAKYGEAISIWIDDEQWTRRPGLNKNELLMEGLKRSKCILCCVTSDYSKSIDCQNELSYALRVHKGPRAILMLDRYDDLANEGVKLQIINETRLNFYNNKVAFDMNVTPNKRNQR